MTKSGSLKRSRKLLNFFSQADMQRGRKEGWRNKERERMKKLPISGMKEGTSLQIFQTRKGNKIIF